MVRKSALEKAEAALTAFGLTFPETAIGPGWATTRVLKVKEKMFFVFGERKEAPG